MPNVQNVSDIAIMLSGIIQKEDALQNVRVQGKVSVGKLPYVFFLSHAGKRIRCFIPGGGIALFGPLLTEGNPVTVIGNIDVFPIFSEYQIRVEDVQPLGINGVPTVSKITQQLSDIIEDTPELAEIHVRGEISKLARQSEATFWFLKETSRQQIRCVNFDDDLIQNGTSVTNGNRTRVTGKIQIWGAQSRYQIKVTDIKPDNSTEQCQCSGCAQCTSRNQCGRPREAANFESCATCLPRPPDELYELCPECYEISRDHETKVADAVYAYLDGLQVNGFSPYIHIRNATSECKECQIQFGARNGIADVVLADGNGSFAAIAECKGAGYVGHGIEQLKSYLSATDTRFGVFANRAKDLNQWKFYENRRRNQIEEIEKPEFEDAVVAQITRKPRLMAEISGLEGEKSDLQQQVQNLELDIGSRNVTLGKLSGDIEQRRQKIEKCNKEINKHHNQRSELQQQIEELKTRKSELENVLGERHQELKDNIDECYHQRSELQQQIEELKTRKSELENVLGGWIFKVLKRFSKEK